MAQINFDEATVKREDIEQVQLERLQALLNRASRNVTHYHDLFKSIDFQPQDLSALEDIAKIPLTSRETFLDKQPYGMLAVAPRDVVRLHSALGPEGHPVVIANTRGDLHHWAELAERSLRQGRITRDDAVMISLDYGKSVAAFGIHYGAEMMGSTVIPRSNLLMSDQLEMMKNYRVTALVCTPSYAHTLGHFIESESFDPKTLFLRSVILVGESSNGSLKGEIAERLFAKVYSAYGLDEVFNPGIAYENSAQDGLIINEDHFLAEILNPTTGEVQPEGEVGELVLTTLTREALPLIRYRTGEMASTVEHTLESGRQSLLLNLTGQRLDGLVQVDGVKFYPEQIETVLKKIIEHVPRFSIIINEHQTGEQLILAVEIYDEAFATEMAGVVQIKDDLESELYLKFGLTFHLRWMERESLKESPKVQDNRSL